MGEGSVTSQLKGQRSDLEMSGEEPSPRRFCVAEEREVKHQTKTGGNLTVSESAPSFSKGHLTCFHQNSINLSATLARHQ